MAAHSQTCAQIDNSFGPYAQYCRGGFDFTLLFEETILSIVPLGLLLLVTPFRLRYLSKREKKVINGPLLHIKIASLAAFAALHLVLLILWVRPDVVRTSTSIAANALTLVGAVTFCLLSYAEHTRTVAPSTLLNAYFLFTIPFDTARARSLWLREEDDYKEIISLAFSATVGLKFVILLLEAVGKRWSLRPRYKAYPPEATSGIVNRSFFWWLNSLFWEGFSKLLFVNDLFVLDKHLASERIHIRMRVAWDKVKKKSPNSLLFMAFGTLKWPLLSIIFPRLCLIGFNYSQPFLISRAMSLTTQPINESTNNAGYGLIGAYFIVYVGIAISMGQYQHRTYRAITMVRGGLISMLYEKVPDLSILDVDPASSMTLMSADIERIVQGWQTMHEIWANAIEIAVAIFLLERELGVACVVPIAVSILSLGGSILAMNFVVSRQAAWLEAIERRISATSAMLGSMKGIKMSGLRQTLMTNLQNLRVEELDISKKFRRLLIWNMAFAYVTQVFAPIITFAVFAIISRGESGGVKLDVNRIFTSLSLFSLLSEPLASIIMSLVTFLGSVGCFVRIQEFLDKAPRQDSRQKPTYLQETSSPTAKTLDGSRQTSVISNDTSELSASVTIKSRLSFSFKDSFAQTPNEDAVMVRSGTFGWDPDKEPILKSITLTIPRGKLTMIIGPVGCGKSTLLKTFLGEVPTMGGTVQVASTNMAYCDQTPWHMNETIQQSILATLDLDQTWYNSVIRACALEEDLGQLPRGDQTVVGSKGVALSGGQSQRIALARAVYAQRDIVILDDVLSGIDASTENHIFHNLFGEDGLLRRLHSTVVIASSSPKRLPYCDHIIALDADGRIAEHGSFKDLNATGGYVSSFSLGAADWNSKPEPVVQGKLSSVIRPSEEGQTSETIEAEANRRTGDMSIYLYYVGSIGWLPTIIFIVAITGFVFCTTFPQIWLKWWATANIEAPNKRLDYYLGIYAMLGVLAIICLVVGCWQMVITMVPKSGVNFHMTLLKTVLSAPLSFFSTTDTGVTLNRFSQDLQLIDMELPIAALNTFTTLVLCMAQMVLIGVASKYAAIAFPVVLATLYMIQKYYLRTSRQLRFMELEAKAPLYSQFEEALNGLATIRAFGWQNALEEKNRKLLDRSQRPFYLLFSVQRWLTLVLDLVVAAIAVMLIIIVVRTRGTMTAGYVGIALLNIITFSQTIKLLVTFWATLETHIGAIARIKVFNESAEPEDKDSENLMPPPTWPSSEGGIEFQSISAEYKPGEPVLKEVSLLIAPGEKIGVCGRTGSGKSSLVLSIFRMIELSSGKITIDGIDISTIPRQEIRSRITGVAQDAFLLKGTTRVNVDPSGHLSDGAIINALQSVQLWSVIEEKGGLDTDVDELHLSHGQKQLLCLARALLRPSTILVLDEATSNIDTKTDDIMQRVIREKFSGHTVIAVAHKLDTILDYDKVALLDSGELVEFDDPYTLLSCDSAFAKLYASTMAEHNDDDGLAAEEITLTSSGTPSGVSGLTSRS